MSIETMLFGPAFLGIFIASILYVLFGQITVKKLRKNPETKDALGFEFISGWDVLNAAQALAFPKSWMKKLESSSLSAMYAKSELLRKHTTALDNILAISFYWILILSSTSLVLISIFQDLFLK